MPVGPQVSQLARAMVAKNMAAEQDTEQSRRMGENVREQEVQEYVRKRVQEEAAKASIKSQDQERSAHFDLLMSAARSAVARERLEKSPDTNASAQDICDIIQAKLYGSDAVLPLLKQRNEKQSMKKTSDSEGTDVLGLLAGAGLIGGGALAARSQAGRSMIGRALGRNVDDAGIGLRAAGPLEQNPVNAARNLASPRARYAAPDAPPQAAMSGTPRIDLDNPGSRMASTQSMPAVTQNMPAMNLQSQTVRNMPAATVPNMPAATVPNMPAVTVPNMPSVGGPRYAPGGMDMRALGPLEQRPVKLSSFFRPKTSFFRRNIGDTDTPQAALAGIGNEQALNEYLVQQRAATTGDRAVSGGLGAALGATLGGLTGAAMWPGWEIGSNNRLLRAMARRPGRTGLAIGGLAGAIKGVMKPTPGVDVYDVATGAPLEGMDRSDRRDVIKILNKLQPGNSPDNFNVLEGSDLGRAGENLDADIAYAIDFDEAIAEDPQLRAALGGMDGAAGMKTSSSRRGYALQKASEFSTASAIYSAQGRVKASNKARRTAVKIIQHLKA